VNAFNRFILLILSLLLIAVPVLLLLINWGIVPADVIDQYTRYRAAVGALGNVSTSSLSTVARTVIAIVGALVALIALIFLLRELGTLGRRVSRSTAIDSTPGRETVITANAVKTLAESAAREVGAQSPSVSLTSKKESYVVSTGIQVPPTDNYTEMAARARENIRKVLGDQGVPVKDVEVTVRGTAS
jgi:hypothetical protein